MHVIALGTSFSRQLTRLINAGGISGSAGRQARQIIGALSNESDGSEFQRIAGEPRLSHSVRYVLPGSHELVTLQPAPSVVVTGFVGTTEAACQWIDQNLGLRLLVDPLTKHIEVARTQGQLPEALPPAMNLPAEARPFDTQLPYTLWKTLLPGSAQRRALAGLTTESEDDAILQFCTDVAEDLGDVRGKAILDILLDLREGRVERAVTRAQIALGTYREVSAVHPIGEVEIRDPVNSEHVTELSSLTEHQWSILLDPKKFQDWMVFLHPDQKRVAEEDHTGPVALDGVSGSGKTCVLVHRAKWLAGRFPKERILVITLNRSLARLLNRLCCRLCSEEEKARIEVCSFHEYVAGLLRFEGLGRLGEALREPLELTDEVAGLIASQGVSNPTGFFVHRDEGESQAIWNAFAAAQDSGSQRAQERFTRFLQENTDQPDLDAQRYLGEELSIVQSVGTISDGFFGTYLEHDRAGRSIRLDRQQRQNVLGILRTWLKYQLRLGEVDESWMTQAALVALAGKPEIPSALRFRSVLVDEYQDFSSLEIDLLRRIPTATANGLFLTGDQAQRVHTKHLDMARARLSTIERRRIRKNYRNSRQILEAGQALLDAYCSVSTAIEAGVKVVPPEYAARNSAKPFLCQTKSAVAGAWACAREWIDAGNPPFTVCIVTAAPQRISIDDVMTASCALAATRLTGDFVFDSECVVVSDVTAVKGFEFSLVIILGVDEGCFPKAGTAQNELWRDALRLYVAMTRARDELCLLHEGRASPFVTVMQPFLQHRLLAESEAPVDSLIEPTRARNRDTKQEAPRIPVPGSSQPNHPVEPLLPAAKAKTGVEPVPPRPSPAPAVPAKSPMRPAPDESDAPSTVVSGYTLLRTPLPCNQLILSRLLNLSHTRLQLACYEYGLFITPLDPVPEVFVRKLMARHDCAPVFTRTLSGVTAGPEPQPN